MEGSLSDVVPRLMERGGHYAVGIYPGSRWFVELLAFGERGRVQVNPINEQGSVIGRPFWTQESLITGTLREEVEFKRRRDEVLGAFDEGPPLYERVGAAFRGIKDIRGLDLGDFIGSQIQRGRNITLAGEEITAIADRISQLSRGVSL